MSENIFIDGMSVKAPNPKAPDYVKLNISIKRKELILWLSGQTDDWINAQVKESKGGKLYIALDTWKKQETAPSADEGQNVQSEASQEAIDVLEDIIEYPDEEINPDDIPF